MSFDSLPATAHSRHPEAENVQVIVYGHSALFYWWPLWVAGYVIALLTWLHHDQAVVGWLLKNGAGIDLYTNGGFSALYRA